MLEVNTFRIHCADKVEIIQRGKWLKLMFSLFGSERKKCLMESRAFLFNMLGAFKRHGMFTDLEHLS